MAARCIAFCLDTWTQDVSGWARSNSAKVSLHLTKHQRQNNGRHGACWCCGDEVVMMVLCDDG